MATGNAVVVPPQGKLAQQTFGCGPHQVPAVVTIYLVKTKAMSEYDDIITVNETHEADLGKFFDDSYRRVGSADEEGIGEELTPSSGRGRAVGGGRGVCQPGLGPTQ
jgi:hypothetical protein